MRTERTVETISILWRGLLADAREVLLHWREAQAQLSEVSSGSPEAARLRVEMQGLRDEYGRLIEEARSVGRELMPVQEHPRRLDA